MTETATCTCTCIVDGVAASGVPADDRGLAYGDGLFETILVHRGQCIWWDEHLDRLRDGAQRLAIAMPDERCWIDDAARLLAESPTGSDAVLKLLLTRGSSTRGYAADARSPSRRIVICTAAPRDAAIARRDGIRARWCELRLAVQPRLAGMKHLNRLEQVLARAEWTDATVAEGLLRDSQDRVICATAGNLFLVRDGRLSTPPVDGCGVAGVCRRWVLQAANAGQAVVSMEDVQQADELFVCNSVRGILPLVALGDRTWPIGPLTRELMSRLADAHPAFAEGAR